MIYRKKKLLEAPDLINKTKREPVNIGQLQEALNLIAKVVEDSGSSSEQFAGDLLSLTQQLTKLKEAIEAVNLSHSQTRGDMTSKHEGLISSLTETSDVVLDLSTEQKGFADRLNQLASRIEELYLSITQIPAQPETDLSAIKKTLKALKKDVDWLVDEIERITKELKKVGEWQGSVAYSGSTAAGDVTAAANLTDHAIVRGAGGAKGVQTSLVIVDDSGNVIPVDGTNIGDATHGLHQLYFANTLIDEEYVGEWVLRFRNPANTAYTPVWANQFECFGIAGLKFSINASKIQAPNTDDNYTLIMARDNGNALIEIARLQGAADPYMQATLPMVFLPIATASLPATPVTGMVTFDSTLGKLVVYTGAAWLPIDSPGQGIETIGTATFNDSTHILTIATGITYWFDGVQKIISGSVTCDIDTYETLTTNTVYWFYFDDVSGTLKCSDGTPNFRTQVPVAAVFWNGTNGAIYREWHNHTRDIDWHTWAHDTVGLRYESGLTLTAPTTAADSTLQIESGNIMDEDLESVVTQQTTCRVVYKASASVYTWANSSLPYAGTASQPQWLDTDNYTLTNVGASDFVCMWVYVTDDIDRPIYIIPTHAATAHNVIALARGETQPVLAALNLSPELKLIYRFIYKGDGQFQESLDYRLTQALPSGGIATVNAGSVSVIPAGDIAATTVQTALEELDTEKVAIADLEDTPTEDEADKATTSEYIFDHVALTTAHGITRGIADDNLLEVDDADAADDDYCKLTANGIEGRSASEVRTDINTAVGASSEELLNTLPAPLSGRVMKLATADSSVFSADIAGAPSSTSVVYDGDSNENMFSGLSAYDGSAYWGQIVLHNTTRSNSRKIVSVNRGTNTITTTASVDDWADNDVITCQSTTLTDWANFFDIDLSDMISATDIAADFLLQVVDVEGAGDADRYVSLHPFEQADAGKLVDTYFVLALENTKLAIRMETNSQKLCMRIGGGVDSAVIILQVMGTYEYAIT